MKKTIITTVVALAVCSSAFSQGLVTFGTGATSSNRISTNSVVGGAATGAIIGANNYYFALFASSSQTSVAGVTTAQSGANGTYVVNNLGGGTPSTGWELVGLGASQASLGRMGAISQGTTSAGQGALNADNSLSVQGIGGGGLANLVAIGWSANIGSTLASLEAWLAAPGVTGWIGQSAVGQGAQLGDGVLILTPGAMGGAASQFAGFTLGIVTTPEPGTLALAALGGASLLLFRRKK
jgi:hypothetical protein